MRIVPTALSEVADGVRELLWRRYLADVERADPAGHQYGLGGVGEAAIAAFLERFRGMV